MSLRPIDEQNAEPEDHFIAPSLEYLDALLNDIPAGNWVAVSERMGKVMAYGVDPQAVLDKARADGEKLPLILRIPERNMAMFY